jgi:hypothetical protein
LRDIQVSTSRQPAQAGTAFDGGMLAVIALST